MIIIGIDPSFTGCGVAVYDTNKNKFIETHKFKSDIKIYESITNTQKASEVITAQVSEVLLRYKSASVIIEYPAAATRSGSYLMCLHGYLSSFINRKASERFLSEVCYVPPTACDSFTKNKEHSKTYLVKYALSKSWTEKKTSHDICTAMIFCELYQAIKKAQYKNSYFINGPKP